MRKSFYIILTLLLVPVAIVFAQDEPYSGETVHLDSTGKADNPVPFDRRFYLQRDKINTEGIDNVELFRVKYKNGLRILYPDKHKKNSFTADYIFKRSKDFFTEKDRLTLLVPPLKPNKDFDILVLRGVTGLRYTITMELNEDLIKGPLKFTQEAHPRIIPDTLMKQRLTSLRSLANNNSTDTCNEKDPKQQCRNVFPISINDFYNKITVPTKPYYLDATNDNNLRSVPFLSFADIRMLETVRFRLNRRFADSYILEQIDHAGNFGRVLEGYIPVAAPLAPKEEDPYDLAARISNIKGSLLLFDSLSKSVNELVIVDPSRFKTLREGLEKIISTLIYNKSFLEGNLKSINGIIKNQAQEAVWLMGDTRSKDLQTKGGTLFTLDLGMVNMWVRDLDNKTAYIPKLFYGVDIYFRPVDKNVRRKYLPRESKADNNEDYGIIATPSIFQKLCLTAGFTIGSLDKNNFDNFFGGSSLLLGPGYRITRSMLVSTGICFMKRSSLNPLITEKKFTSGYYASLSIDFDLLGTLSKVTGLLLK